MVSTPSNVTSGDVTPGNVTPGNVTHRYVIVNADDFGLSPGVNKGIADAHEHGIVTSASLMVFQPGAQEAAEWARTHPAMSVGIHIDLCEWVYVNESWELLYERCNVDDAAAVATEVVRQLSHFRHLTGHIPTHVDCHQHVHRSEPAGAVIRAEAAALGVPLRDHSAATYVGNFYGQMNTGEALPDLVSADALVGLIRDLPEGWSELACHAGYAEDTTSVYRDERRLEVEALCDPKVRAALADEGVELRAFRDLVQR